VQKIPKCHRGTSHTSWGCGGFLGLYGVKKQAPEYRVARMARAVLAEVPSCVAEAAVKKKCLLRASAPGATFPEGCAVLQSASATLLLPQRLVSVLA